MVHMFAPSAEKDMLSTITADYYEVTDSRTTSSPAFRSCYGFLFTAAVAIATLAYISNTDYKGEASSHTMAHTSVIKLVPPSTSLKDRRQGKVIPQMVSLGKEETQVHKEVLRPDEMRQTIRVQLFNLQSAANAARDASLMAQAAEVNARLAGTKAKATAKEVQEAAEIAANVALRGGQETGSGDAKSEASMGEAAAADADSKATVAILDAMEATDEAKKAARDADEAMARAEEASNGAKALQAIAHESEDQAAVALAAAEAAGAKVDEAETEAIQARTVMEEMQAANGDAKALEKALAEAKEAFAKLDQLIEMAIPVEEEAKEAAELAQEAAHAAEVAAVEAKGAASDASDATVMAEQATKEASEAAAEVAQATLMADAAQKYWAGARKRGDQDPLIIQ